jgi:hypothetical protein
MGNPIPNLTHYKIEQMHWRGALNRCIEQMYWLINIHQYILSLTYQKKKRKRICHYYQRKRKRKDTLLRLEEFRLWKI